MKDESLCSITACSHYAVCIKRISIQNSVPTKNVAEALLGIAGKHQRIEATGNEAAKELGHALAAWIFKWCPDRDGAKSGLEAA